MRRYRLTKARSPDYKTLQDLRPDTSRRPQEGLAAYLKEVELAAGMQTKAGDRAVARRLNDLELAFAALRRSLAPAKPRPALLW